MKNKINIDSFFPIKFNKEFSISYYTSCFLLAGWIFLSLISIFFIGLSNILNGFVLFSILIRIIIAAVGSYFYYNIFINFNKSKKLYQYFKAFVGYGIVFTYVFYSFPRLVGEYLLNVNKIYSITNFIFILVISIFPFVLYLMLNLNSTKLILEIYSKKDIDYEKKIKKDKVLKKKEHTKIKNERSFIENLWYEWVDVILQAIIIALIIQQFFFQMYQIPSESMVPTFLIKDRVVVNKLVYGPHIPLTDWKLPSPFKPKIGDIVVFINPKADDPESDIRYNNLFSRIFHPFVYMLTLSLVDIDKYPPGHPRAGNPKERFIVKRMIANEGEKICLLNDKVYKRTKNSSWKKMSEIEKQKEYGQVDLYFNENPNMYSQQMTPYVRSILSELENEVSSKSFDDIENELVKAKSLFLNKYSSLNKTLFKIKYDNIQEKYKNDFQAIKSNLRNEIAVNLNFNNKAFILKYFNKSDLSSEEINMHVNNLEEMIKKYKYITLNELFKQFVIYIGRENSGNNIFNQINTAIKIRKNMDPYTEFMKKINAIDKINKLQIFSIIIDNFNNNKLDSLFNIENNFLLNIKGIDFIKQQSYINIYLDGLPSLYYYAKDNELYYYTIDLFSIRNFKEYPGGENNYIGNNEYFMMGDNRYNSLDSRLGEFSDSIFLDNDDRDILSRMISVSWDPHTIKSKYVLGKAEFIYWPLERVQRLK